jgi:C_GCAxxG_C_C family probable redox protein
MARKQEVCGAVTGGILVLGLRHGRGSEDDRAAMESTYLKTRELMDQFSRKHGTFICRELLHGCDLMTEEGQQYCTEHELLEKICTPCIRTVVEILERIV